MPNSVSRPREIDRSDMCSSTIWYTMYALRFLPKRSGTGPLERVPHAGHRYSVKKNFAVERLIPSLVDQNRCAQSRIPMDMMSQGWSVSLFHASQQWSRMSLEAKMRLEIQLSRMYCQMFSTGFNSGALEGSGTSVMVAGTTSFLD